MAVPMIQIFLNTRDQILVNDYEKCFNDLETRFMVQTLNLMVNDYIKKNHTQEVYDYFMDHITNYRSFSGHPNIAAKCFTMNYYGAFTDNLQIIADELNLPPVAYHQAVNVLCQYYDGLDEAIYKNKLTDKLIAKYDNRVVCEFDNEAEFNLPIVKEFLRKIVTYRTHTSSGVKIEGNYYNYMKKFL